MSKISKYRENIYDFIINKSCIGNMVDKKIIRDFLDSDLVLFPIALLSIFCSQVKKNKIKSFHTLHIACAIILMTLNININEKKKVYVDKYGENVINNFLSQSVIFIFECVSQNMTTLENSSGIEKSLKIQKQLFSILHEKLLLISSNNIKNTELKIIRSDIIKYKFSDFIDVIDNNYKKLKRLDKNDLLKYIDDKYGSVGQCVFLFGWILGMGNDSEKTLETISRTGKSFGILIKLVFDFYNLENDIKNSKNFSYNYLINYGIHSCFEYFNHNKIIFFEGCMINHLYNSCIKEIIESVDKTYEKCLDNVNLELNSKYSSFISEK